MFCLKERTFTTVQTKHPLLEHPILSIPKTKGQAHSLMIVTDD
jgi:hypothetical protein